MQTQNLPEANQILTSSQAAIYLGIEPSTLDVWRCTKRHLIPFIKVGRLVKYRRSDLDKWLSSQTVDLA